MAAPISIHKALASLDFMNCIITSSDIYFNPQGSREPRRKEKQPHNKEREFQSTRLSRASTITARAWVQVRFISIHKALASLDLYHTVDDIRKASISIHKALASLDDMYTLSIFTHIDFNPQGSREPRLR